MYLPPDDDSMHHHLVRVNYVTYCQKHYELRTHPCPFGNGWALINDKCRPVRHSRPVLHSQENTDSDDSDSTGDTDSDTEEDTEYDESSESDLYTLCTFWWWPSWIMTPYSVHILQYYAEMDSLTPNYNDWFILGKTQTCLPYLETRQRDESVHVKFSWGFHGEVFRFNDRKWVTTPVSFGFESITDI
ncbi:hypothetical protein GQR58_017854 [Nymphon striatum]|nr:hypothetical protein GQR58_017854 [Nymphon striatum]